MTKRKAGRKPIQIDLLELEKLCSLHCTNEELANWFGVSVRTLETRQKRPEFAEAMQRGRAKGRISVRRAQMKMLESGNSTMGVWLGKQMLGQREIITNEHVGKGGSPIRVTVQPDLSKLTDADLQQLFDLTRKTMPSGDDGAAMARESGPEPRGNEAATAIPVNGLSPTIADDSDEVSHE